MNNDKPKYMQMKKTILTLSAVLLCTAAIAQSGPDLRLNLEKNRVYRLQSRSDQTIVQTVNGNQQTIETGSDYTISLKMVDATPEFIVTEVRFDTMITRTNTMGKVTVMSSASAGDVKSEESSDIISYFLNRLSKTPLYAKIDYTGRVVELVNSRMLSSMILKDTSQITLEGLLAPAMKEQVVNLVSDNALINIIEMFTRYLPGRAVKEGESWTLTSSVNSGGMALNVETTSHLDGVSGNKASVTAESSIKASPNAPPMQQGPARITYDNLQGLTKSSMVIDTATGLLVESSAKSRITGNLAVSVPGMEMQIPLDIISESKVTSVQ